MFQKQIQRILTKSTHSLFSSQRNSTIFRQTQQYHHHQQQQHSYQKQQYQSHSNSRDEHYDQSSNSFKYAAGFGVTALLIPMIGCFSLGASGPDRWVEYNRNRKKETIITEEMKQNIRTLEQVHPQAHQELKEIFGDRYSLSFDDLLSHSKDAHSYHGDIPANAVVFPLTTEEVSRALQVCNKYNIKVVAFGSGTSLEGHTNTPHAGVVFNLSKMDAIHAIHVDDMDCVVGPGITWDNLNDQLKHIGLFFPMDPGPGASIGGMTSTGCSGTNAVRYGTMRDNVLNLTIVLPDGRIIKTGQRSRKSSAGYDLTRMFIGTEGTLGIVTEITLKLKNLPSHTAVAACNFASIDDASKAVISLMRQGVQIGCVELLDDVMIRAVNEYSGLKYEEKPTLFFKFAGSMAQVEDSINTTKQIVSSHSAGPFQWATNDAEREKLWEARKGALWASHVLRPDAQVMITDVCVPISRLAECIEATKQDLRNSFLPAPLVGHVGDGNFHVFILFNPSIIQEKEEAIRLADRMAIRAIEMEGTCTGEHGIGVGKRHFLLKEKGELTVDLMRQIKKTIDPNSIMNPDKIFFLDPKQQSSSSLVSHSHQH